MVQYLVFIYCSPRLSFYSLFFFFNDTATTEIYTLSLHDALPIFQPILGVVVLNDRIQTPRNIFPFITAWNNDRNRTRGLSRSEEHTSELQSRSDLVCRLLLEKKKKNSNNNDIHKIHSRRASRKRA